MLGSDDQDDSRWGPLVAAVPPALTWLVPGLMRLFAAEFPPDGENDEEFLQRVIVAGLNTAWVRAYARARWANDSDPTI